MIFLLWHLVHVITVFWETGSGEDRHPEKRCVDPSQPSLPAVCHQRWGNLTVWHQVGPTYGTRLTMCICAMQLYEEVRKSLEQCNIQEDIEHFVNLRRTGDKPPGILSSSISHPHTMWGQVHGQHQVISNGIHAANLVWGWKVSQCRFHIKLFTRTKCWPAESYLVWKWLFVSCASYIAVLVRMGLYPFYFS